MRARATLILAATVAVFAPAAGGHPPPVFDAHRGAATAGTVRVSEEHFSRGPRVRPETIVGGDSFGYSGLVWSSWGGSTAEATGVYGGLDFSDGTERQVTYPATITLSRPRQCGRFTLYTRATAVVQGAESDTLSGPVGNVGCRIVILWAVEGNAEVNPPYSLEKPSVIERPPSRPFRSLRWRGWGSAAARARGVTRSSGLARVRIRVDDVGFCGPDLGLVYRRVRIRLSGAERWRSTHLGHRYCREARL